MKKTDKEKPLPKPLTTAFGRKKRSEQEEQTTLMADRMAAAMSEGKLEEFLQQEMPDNEYARNLATMMMGMTGIMPAGNTAVSSHTPENREQPLSSENATSGQRPSAEEIPDDVRQAIQGGDVRELMDLLRREHQKGRHGTETKTEEEVSASQPVGQPTIDKELIDELIRIATDNSVTLDWIMLRAIRLYVQEYQKTGRL
ncbi:MAG TPA: hypothetical protein VL087_09615 [Nitrospirota bacterium]|nr:hypothetical protein [Nitrospirota bacterium]